MAVPGRLGLERCVVFWNFGDDTIPECCPGTPWPPRPDPRPRRAPESTPSRPRVSLGSIPNRPLPRPRKDPGSTREHILGTSGPTFGSERQHWGVGSTRIGVRSARGVGSTCIGKVCLSEHRNSGRIDHTWARIFNLGLGSVTKSHRLPRACKGFRRLAGPSKATSEAPFGGPSEAPF